MPVSETVKRNRTRPGAASADFATVIRTSPDAVNLMALPSRFTSTWRRWPASPKAQEILWSRAMDAERAGNCAEATPLYEKVKAGGGRRADWARFREGYCWFRIGDHQKALVGPEQHAGRIEAHRRAEGCRGAPGAGDEAI